MEIHYRECKEEDYQIISTFLTDLIQSESSFNLLRLNNPPILYGEKYLAELINSIKNHRGIIYVAEVDQEVIGCGVGIIKQQTENDLLEYKKLLIGEIPDIFIKKEYRKMGIGKELIRNLENFFRENDCDYATLDVSARNTLAHEFYKKIGYENNLISLLKKL